MGGPGQGEVTEPGLMPGTAVQAPSGGDELPAEAVLSGLNATVSFSSTDGIDSHEMFAPTCGWARPPLEGYKGASVFVDGKVLRHGESMTSGVLGPVGFAVMCVGCGRVSNSFDAPWGFPFCDSCKGPCSSAAQARKLWRTQAAFVSPLEEGTCFGMAGRSVDRSVDPRVIADRVLLELFLLVVVLSK